jgi:quercetin dioxygenase-like cupin family protein
MAIPHAQPGQIIDIRPLAERLTSAVTTTLIKTDHLEVIRLVLPAGKEIPPHQTPGEITVQCLEGVVHFTSGGRTQVFATGQLMYLDGNELHALKAIDDASVLVTILLRKKA